VVARVEALTQATVRIAVTNGPVIYIDPTGINTSPADADVILLTHNHGDHQSVPVLGRLRKPGTVFVSSPPGVPQLQQNFAGAPIHAVTPGDRLEVAGIAIEAVPMYNVVKNNHPRALNYVGYVLNLGGVRLYHAGDTERFPEMKGFAADVVMLPLGQVFTMNTVQEAVDAAVDLKARIAIPIHWGNAEGTRADAEFFAAQTAARGMQSMVNTPPGGFALEVSESVAISEHPASVTVAPGGTAQFSVQATGTGNVRYQWRRNGLAVPGGTTATLAIPFTSAANAGDYEVVVSDANGPAVSRTARLVVETRPAGEPFRARHDPRRRRTAHRRCGGGRWRKTRAPSRHRAGAGRVRGRGCAARSPAGSVRHGERTGDGGGCEQRLGRWRLRARPARALRHGGRVRPRRCRQSRRGADDDARRSPDGARG